MWSGKVGLEIIHKKKVGVSEYGIPMMLKTVDWIGRRKFRFLTRSRTASIRVQRHVKGRKA
jgi:hypothetical protein